ncbi:hypothetical protein MHU86_13512 [Fragilaria crotonensis]|nr:hypothetical protein MHU86_13512 [Fragilaria crotonensis]
MLHPWKNTAAYIAQPVLQVPTDDLIHFITPNITTIAKSSQIIFAIRFGFTPKHPRAWRKKDTTKETMMLNKVKIQVSNSTSNCGDSVTAGYILLKHPKMTHKTWYLEFLRQQVPKETPYFDLQLQHKTPVGQSISHIAVLCGVPTAAPIRLSTENLLQNIPWGDTLASIDPTHTRFYGMNASNGIQLDREGGQFTEYCKLHAETQADISGIQEHNLDTTQPRLRRIMYDTVRKHWKRSTFSHASTPITFASPYKPGGTLLLSTDSIIGRVVDHGSDTWGRWAYQSLQGRQRIKVTFISAYQVEQKEKIASLAASASMDDQHKAKILRNIRVSEAIKRVYDKIRAFRNTNTPKGITQVEIPRSFGISLHYTSHHDLYHDAGSIQDKWHATTKPLFNRSSHSF